jgi:hypothetical protein
MLTPVERHAARTAPFRLGLGHGYGTPAVGLCPIGAVAVLRGAVLWVGPDGEYSAYRLHRNGTYVPSYHTPTIRRATEDVLAWSGYATLTAFLRAWEAQGAACLPVEEDNA